MLMLDLARNAQSLAIQAKGGALTSTHLACRRSISYMEFSIR